ncbi:hypothetical protein CEXT_458491 [Caerostris extrusa]|uniref:Uncharacterized protein n=1 Tax=Caerostris extrusa TaxID=172846 RepID=A0AAV4W990_CAEEX|nr:hypothetical protein CEXT_458491 [Caerostris extrusa]
MLILRSSIRSVLLCPKNYPPAIVFRVPNKNPGSIFSTPVEYFYTSFFRRLRFLLQETLSFMSEESQSTSCFRFRIAQPVNDSNPTVNHLLKEFSHPSLSKLVDDGLSPRTPGTGPRPKEQTS